MRAVLMSVLVVMSAGVAMAAPSWVQKDEATLRALDKITGRSTDIKVTVGEPVEFGSLRVSLDVCYQTPPEEAPESAAFLQIHSLKPVDVSETAEAEPKVFSGWMFASSPGLSALEHPVYDVWVVECETPDVTAGQ